MWCEKRVKRYDVYNSEVKHCNEDGEDGEGAEFSNVTFPNPPT